MRDMEFVLDKVKDLFKEEELEEVIFEPQYTLEDQENDGWVKVFSKDYVTKIWISLPKGCLGLFISDGGYGSDGKPLFIIGTANFENYPKKYGSRLALLLEEIIIENDFHRDIYLMDTSEGVYIDGKLCSIWELINNKLTDVRLERG